MDFGKYTCTSCGLTFDNPLHYVEVHGLDYPPYEDFYECPYCGGRFVETTICKSCGNAITDKYYTVVTTGDRYCRDCCKPEILGDGT